MMFPTLKMMRPGRRFGNLVRVGIVAPLATVTALATGAAAQVAPCQTNCAALTVGSAMGPRGGSATVSVSFAQAPTSDGSPGGPDDVAALAFTLLAPGNGSGVLGLDASGCTPGDDPTLPSAVEPTANLDGYRLVLENYRCDDGRTHCVCPEQGSGITPDDFLNIAIYGPDPLPDPGSGPVVIPELPSATLFNVRFAVAGEAVPGSTVPLHVLNQVDDTDKGAFQAFLSLGDTEAVDQTCVPQVGTPPCTATNARSQVTVADGTVTVQEGVAVCGGDCDASGDVTVDEIITLVNIALGTVDVTQCTRGDTNSDGEITVEEIVAAVTFALNGCPG